jgi:AraC family transcriptional regulator
MNMLKKMNNILNYIEENLDKKIDNNKISKLALCSVYHFQKIFSIMSGISFYEYVRNRRLDRAAFDLRNGNEKVIEIALKYGYESPTAFNRAFQKMHGIAPNKVRLGKEVKLQAYPPITFQISIKGAVMMNYQIINQKSFRAVGVKLITSTKNDEQLKKIPLFWDECCENGSYQKLVRLCENQPINENIVSGILGICIMDESSNNINYYIAVATDKRTPEGMEEVIIPDCTYAVFESIGAMPNAIQDLTKRIYTEWLPNSGYEWTNAPDIERYSEGDITKDDYKCWVYLPVSYKVKKEN